MKTKHNRSAYVGGCVLLFVLASFDTKRPDRLFAQAPSSVYDEIHERWASIDARLGTRSKEAYTEKMLALDDLWKRLTPDQILSLNSSVLAADLEHSCDADVQLRLISYFIQKNDSQSLIALLNHHFISESQFGLPVEFEIARSGIDALRILLSTFRDAALKNDFRRCEQIAMVLRRAMPQIQNPGLTDDDFAGESKRWRNLHSADLAFNPKYLDKHGQPQPLYFIKTN